MVENIIQTNRLRHPRSEDNEQNKITRHQQVKISLRGEKEAELFAYHHKDIITRDTLIVTGTQKRSEQLVDILKQYNLNLEIYETPNLNERDFGILGGLSKKEILEFLRMTYPDLIELNGDDFSRWMDRELCFCHTLLFESNARVQQRILQVIDTVTSCYSTYDNILFISSTGLIRNALALALGKGALDVDVALPNNKIPNLSTTTIPYDKERKLFLPPTQIAHIPQDLKKVFDDVRIKVD